MSKKILDVWPQRPNQEIISITDVFTERASRRRGGELFIRDDYTGRLVKYTTSPVPSQQICYAPPAKKRKKEKILKASPSGIPIPSNTTGDATVLPIVEWPIQEYPEFYLPRLDAAIRSLPQFDDRHADNLWTVLNMAYLDDLMKRNAIQHIDKFYENEIIPAIQNFKEYMSSPDGEENQTYYDVNRGEYEEFDDDDNEGTVTIPLVPKPEIFPFQIASRENAPIEEEVPEAEPEPLNARPLTSLERLIENNAEIVRRQRQMNQIHQGQMAFLRDINSLRARHLPIYQTPPLSDHSLFVPPQHPMYNTPSSSQQRYQTMQTIPLFVSPDYMTNFNLPPQF